MNPLSPLSFIPWRCVAAVALFCGVLSPLLVAAQEVGVEDEPWGLCHSWPRPDLSYPGPTGLQGPTFLTADSAHARQGETLTLHGNVLAEQPGQQMRADELIYSDVTQSIEAKGNIWLESAEMGVSGDYAYMEQSSRRGHLTNSEYRLYARHARGHSDVVEMLGPELTRLRRASYTTCDPEGEAWLLKASTVTLDHAEGFGRAYNARLVFKRVPLFYFPYVSFPLNDRRKSGFLMPGFERSGNSGIAISVPYYLNFHPQLDATLTPRNYVARGQQLEMELRYLSRYGTGQFGYHRLADDELFGSDRTFFEWSHRGEFAPRWSSDISFTRVSDREYFNDFSNTLSISSATHLERHVRVTHKRDWLQFQTLLQDYQTLDESVANSSRPYRRLPQLTLSANPPQGDDDLLRFSLSSELVRFQRQDRLNGVRLDLSPVVSAPFERAAGYLIPQLTLRHTQYSLESENNTFAQDNPGRTLPVISLDSGLFLERDMAWFGYTSWLHTLEPRLFYLYAPYRDQSQLPLFDTGVRGFNSSQLFQENRFSGADRVGDTNQISASLTTRLLESESGRQRAQATIGQIYYLKDRQVGLNGNSLDRSTKSEVIIEGSANLTPQLKIKSDFWWDTETDQLTRRTFSLHFQDGRKRIFNTSFRETGNRGTAPGSVKREIDSSLIWPLNPHWNLFGRRLHSQRDDRTIEKMVGLEYNSCCWALRFIRRAVFVEDSSVPVAPFGRMRYSWFLQLDLKGFAGLGKGTERIMEDGILGYSEAP